MAEDIIRVLRVVEYVGPRAWVEETVARSIHGTKVVDGHGLKRINASTIGGYPEILTPGYVIPAEKFPPKPE